MKTRLFTFSLPAIAIAYLTGISVAVMAAEKKGSGSSPPPKFSSADETFMMSAAQTGMVEVKLGELAAKKATQEDIKQFGAAMVSDHSKANKELQAIAATNGVTLPSQLDALHKSKVDKMSKLSGEQFDKAYVAEMVKDHEKIAAEFEKAAKTAQNPELKSFAATTLLVLKTHLKHIKAIAAGKSI
jgi:putative membrane protein